MVARRCAAAMSSEQRQVTSTPELLAAAKDTQVRTIIVTAALTGMPTFRLSPGQVIAGTPEASIRFAPGEDGLLLSTDNTVETLRVATDHDRRALFNDTAMAALGRMTLRDLTVTGVVRLLAHGEVQSGHIEACGIDIVAADARGFDERPKGYGVEVVPGAFTLWNRQADPAVTITAELANLSAGRAGAPVRGSGIFVSGAGDEGGRLIASRLETGPVYSDGGIAAGTPDRISGGVFIVHGAFVDRVHNLGPVTTYGANDMVLDNWGTVDHWLAEEKITSHGPSGIGFVNFGTINRLDLTAPVETFGRGARGFNVYDGTVQGAAFERIVTHADGAVGIQIGRPVGEVTVRRGIETHGGTGDSLVKGVVLALPATAFSVKPGGSVQRLAITGGLVTHGPGIAPLELHGRVETLQITGGLSARGAASGTDQTLLGKEHQDERR
jgi:hypothetical protein